MIHITFGGTSTVLYDAWVAEDYGVGGDVYVYVAIGSNKNVITDGDVADDGSVDAYPDSVSYRRSPLAGTSVRLSDDDTFVDVAIPTNAGIGVNGDVIMMTNIQPPPN